MNRGRLVARGSLRASVLPASDPTCARSKIWSGRRIRRCTVPRGPAAIRPPLPELFNRREGPAVKKEARAEILTIGTELLMGQTIDTNSVYIGEALAAAGIEVNRSEE